MSTLLSVNNYFYTRDACDELCLGHNDVFKSHGWRVIPFAMHHEKNLASEWSTYFVKDIDFDRDYSYLQKVVRVPKVIYSLESKRAIERLISATRPKVCHFHNVYHHLSPSVLGVVRRWGIPAFLTLHDLKIACPAYHMFGKAGPCEKCKGGRLINVLRNRCIKDSATLSSLIYIESSLHRMLKTYARNVGRFVAPCQFYIEKLVEWGWPRGSFAHIPHFVDVKNAAPSQHAGQVVLYFGALAPEKGLLTLIRACAAARLRLRIAGDGPQYQELRATAESLSADVKFLGAIGESRLYAEVQNCRATVFPSEWYDNAAVSILKSMALGKPVIGADIGGIPELITEGETGWLFASGSVEALTEKLLHVQSLADSVIVDMGKLCENVAKGEYSRARYYERLSSLYAEFGVSV